MGRFVGIGVDHYEQSAYAPLDFAVSDVASLYQSRAERHSSTRKEYSSPSRQALL